MSCPSSSLMEDKVAALDLASETLWLGSRST